MTNKTITCDRCGQIIAENPLKISRGLNIHRLNSLSTFRLPNERGPLDLCSDCYKDFNKFMSAARFDDKCNSCVLRTSKEDIDAVETFARADLARDILSAIDDSKNDSDAVCNVSFICGNVISKEEDL